MPAEIPQSFGVYNASGAMLGAWQVHSSLVTRLSPLTDSVSTELTNLSPSAIISTE